MLPNVPWFTVQRDGRTLFQDERGRRATQDALHEEGQRGFKGLSAIQAVLDVPPEGQQLVNRRPGPKAIRCWLRTGCPTRGP